jgi:hypothetical protein
VRPSVPAPTLVERARTLVRKLNVLAQQDERRLGAVADYAESRVCRAAVIGRYFGLDHAPRCGRCGVCDPELFRGASPGHAFSRRPPARELSVAPHDGATKHPLTAKLGDFLAGAG